MRRSRLGFSLLELAVVVAVLGILSSLALGLGSDTVQAARAREEKEGVRALLVAARTHARRNAACVRVKRLSASELRAFLFVDPGVGCPANPIAVEPTPNGVALRISEASKFVIGTVSSSELVFFPDGSTRAAGPVDLELMSLAGARTRTTLRVWPGAGIVAEVRG